MRHAFVLASKVVSLKDFVSAPRAKVAAPSTMHGMRSRTRRIEEEEEDIIRVEQKY